MEPFISEETFKEAFEQLIKTNTITVSYSEYIKSITEKINEALGIEISSAQNQTNLSAALGAGGIDGSVMLPPPSTTTTLTPYQWNDTKTKVLLDEMVLDVFRNSELSEDEWDNEELKTSIALKTIPEIVTHFLEGENKYNPAFNVTSDEWRSPVGDKGLSAEVKAARMTILKMEELYDRDPRRLQKWQRVTDIINEMYERELITDEVWDAYRNPRSLNVSADAAATANNLLNTIQANESFLTSIALEKADTGTFNVAINKSLNGITLENINETRFGRLLGIDKNIVNEHRSRFIRFNNTTSVSKQLEIMLGVTGNTDIDKNVRSNLESIIQNLKISAINRNPQSTDEEINRLLFEQILEFQRPEQIELSDAEGGGLMAGKSFIDNLIEDEYRKKGIDLNPADGISAAKDYLRKLRGNRYSLTDEQYGYMADVWYNEQLEAYGKGIAPKSNEEIFSKLNDFIIQNAQTQSQKETMAAQIELDSTIKSSGINLDQYKFDQDYREQADKSLDRLRQQGLGLTPMNTIGFLPRATYIDPATGQLAIAKDELGNIIRHPDGTPKLATIAGEVILDNLNLFPERFGDIYKEIQGQSPYDMVRAQTFGAQPTLSFLPDTELPPMKGVPEFNNVKMENANKVTPNVTTEQDQPMVSNNNIGNEFDEIGR